MKTNENCEVSHFFGKYTVTFLKAEEVNDDIIAGRWTAVL